MRKCAHAHALAGVHTRKQAQKHTNKHAHARAPARTHTHTQHTHTHTHFVCHRGIAMELKPPGRQSYLVDSIQARNMTQKYKLMLATSWFRHDMEARTE